MRVKHTRYKKEYVEFDLTRFWGCSISNRNSEES